MLAFFRLFLKFYLADTPHLRTVTLIKKNNLPKAVTVFPEIIFYDY